MCKIDIRDAYCKTRFEQQAYANMTPVRPQKVQNNDQLEEMRKDTQNPGAFRVTAYAVDDWK